MKQNLVYIISNISKALSFEWISQELKGLPYNLTFVLLNPGNSKLEEYLKANHVNTHRITYEGKKDFAFAFFRLVQILRREKTEIIHTHLFDASLMGLLAGKLLGIQRRIYTRHHATLHHDYFPRAVIYDRLINYLASDIIAISENIKQILIEKEHVEPLKIKLIHHGFKLNAFQDLESQRVELLRIKYSLEDKKPVVGVIARYEEWKGIHYIITAFQHLLEIYPHACLVLANANGPYRSEIQQLLQRIPSENYREITFEDDIMALYQQFDVYIHTPINEHCEAFGQTYIEALAAGIPPIFTLSGVAREFIRDGENAWIVPFRDTEAIYHSLMLIMNEDKEKIDTVIGQGKKDVQELFSLQKMMISLEQLYAMHN